MTHPTKTKTVTVEYPTYQGLLDTNAYYLVTKVQHTTEHLPGTYLTKAQVDDLNDNRSWSVTIVPRKSPV